MRKQLYESLTALMLTANQYASLLCLQVQPPLVAVALKTEWYAIRLIMLSSLVVASLTALKSREVVELEIGREAEALVPRDGQIHESLRLKAWTDMCRMVKEKD